MRVLLNVLAWAAGLLMVLPLAWAVLGSLQAGAAALQNPVGGPPTVGNYVTVLRGEGVGRWLLNSLVIASATAVLGVAVASLAGYALAQKRLPRRRLVTGVLLAALLLPYHALLAPAFELILTLGLFDTYAAVILPGGVSAAGVLLYRQNFGRLSAEVLDAARLDGAGETRIWWQVALPAVRPATAALTLLLFLAGWNAFLWPAVVLQDPAKQPLAVGLASLTARPAFQQNYGLLLAALTLGLLPPVALFLSVQRDLDTVTA